MAYQDILKRRLQKEQATTGTLQTVGGIGGAIVGGVLGGPAGAMAGYSAGSAGGSALGTLASSEKGNDKAMDIAKSAPGIGSALSGAMARKQDALNIDTSKSTIDNAIKAADELPPEQQMKYKPALYLAQERAYGRRLS